MRTGSWLAATAAGAACAFPATAGMDFFRTTSLLSTQAYVRAPGEPAESESDQVLAGTPTIANIDSVVDHLGITATASIDSTVDWNNLTRRFTLDASIAVSLLRTGALTPFALASSAANFDLSAGFAFTERTTVRIDALTEGIGFSILLYRLDIDETFLDTQVIAGGLLEESFTLDAGTYILVANSYTLEASIGFEGGLGGSREGTLFVAVTAIPAPATALIFGGLGALARRRR